MGNILPSTLTELVCYIIPLVLPVALYWIYHIRKTGAKDISDGNTKVKETPEQVRDLNSKNEQVQEHQYVVQTHKAGLNIPDCLIINRHDRVKSEFCSITQENCQHDERQIQPDEVKSRENQLEASSTRHYSPLQVLLFPLGDHPFQIGDNREQIEIGHLQDELKVRYKSLCTMPISPFHEGTIFLQKFCSDIIIEQQTAGKNTTKDKVKEEDNSRDKRKKKLSSYKDIFLDKRNRRIILTGLSGRGKSTFCRKIVDTWCSKEPNKHNTITNGADIFITDNQKTMAESKGIDQPIPDISDQDIFLQFILLFYIYAPKISNEKTFTDVLCNQCLKREPDQVSTFLENQPEQVLIIIDGMDEMGDNIPSFLSDLLAKTLHPKIVVLTAMQPWKISQLELKPLFHYDLLLEVQGLSENNALKFVQTVINQNTTSMAMEKQYLTSEQKDIVCSFRNVPLCLLFLAHIWCQDSGLPKRRQDLYTQSLEWLVKKCLIKTGNKYTYGSTLDDFSNIEKKFWDLYLESACNAAYHFLLQGVSGPSVVMQEKDLMNQLGDNPQLKLSALLDCGILSKLYAFCPLEKNVSITFFHLSIQEYLTSMHLVNNEDAFQNFLISLTTLNDVRRYENIFIFICGLDAKKGQMALKRICQVCDGDSHVIHYRQRRDLDGHIKFSVENLNEIYRACLNEMEGQDIIEVPDILTSNYECYKFVMPRLQPCCVKSLCMYFIQLHHDDQYLSSLINLTYLGLYGVTMSEKFSRSLCSSIRRCAHLKSLVLKWNIRLYDGVLDLKSLADLTYLTLWDVTMSEECSRSLCGSISGCTKLESLEMKHIALYDGVLNLMNLTKLTYLMLWGVTMSGKCSNSLYRCISGCDRMKYLVLRDIKLNDGAINLKSQTNQTSQTMQYLAQPKEHSRFHSSSIRGCNDLKWMLLEDTNVHDGVLDLSNLTNLISLTLWGIAMSGKCSRSLCNSISSCTRIKWLVLRDIKICDGFLNLCSLTNLTSLTLWGITMSVECNKSLWNSISYLRRQSKVHDNQLNWLLLRDIEVPDGLDLGLTDVTTLTLWKITMSERCSRSLCSSITNCTCTELILKDINLHDGELNLRRLTNLTSLTLWGVIMSDYCSRSFCISISDCTHLKWLVMRDIKLHDGVLDLRRLFRLTSLTLWCVTMSRECSSSLCKSISGFIRMKCLLLREIRIDDGLLDLTGLINLTSFNLWDVAMSEECSRYLCGSIGGCSRIESLELSNITLHDGVLGLSSLTNLTSLSVWKVTMSEKCSRTLCKSISDCTRMKWLVLRDIKLHDGILDLRGMTNLTYLTLWDVKMSEECSRFLCSNISGCNHHERLELRYITLSDSLLDLKNQSHLTSLALWGISISVECSRALCSSIGSCTHLEKLELRDITLPDGVLCLSSLTSLTSLTLWKVTMSEKCSISLCSSISGCTRLKSLVQRNIKLHNVVLNLSSLRNLTFFTLRSVTMSEECSRSLSSSISGSTHLVGLYIEFIKLFGGVLKLTTLSVLTSLTLRHVIMSDDCGRSLCSSISGCTHLERLFMESIILHDGVLDLSSLSDLTLLTLRFVTMSEQCCRSLCSSISSCTRMKWLELAGIELHDGVLDMCNLGDLRKLNCLSVNISDKCRERLLESIKHCEKIEEFSFEEL